MPKFYFVPRDYLQDEYSNPGSQTRRPNFQLGDPIFLWGEAVMLIADLMESGYLMAHDLDLLRRHKPFHERAVGSVKARADLVVQVVLISESVRLQQMLATFGVQSQTPTQVEPITLWPNAWADATALACPAGRSVRLGSWHGQVLQGPGPHRAVLPLLFEMRDFYLLHDMDMVIDEVMRSGWVNDVRVLLGRAQNLLASACVDHLDYLQDHNHAFRDLPSVEELSVEKSFRSLMNIQGHAAVAIEQEEWIDTRRVESSNSEQLCQLIDTASLNMGPKTQLLHMLVDRHGADYVLPGANETVAQRLEEMSRTAGVQQRWAIVRYALGHPTQRADHHRSDIVIDRPLTPKELCQILYAHYPPGPSGKAVLLQELILFLGSLICRDSVLFRGIHYIRLDPLIDALDIELANVNDPLFGGCKILQNLSPYKVKSLIVSILDHRQSRHPYWQRRIDGCLCRVPSGFYEGVYGVLEACSGGIRIGHTLIEQHPCLNDMSRNDANFVFAVQSTLARETANPALRQMMVEALVIIELILQRNPELKLKRNSTCSALLMRLGAISKSNTVWMVRSSKNR
uniref:Phosphorylase b kinase regulatory subunit n=1 Tax=Macrostomum lignano TaxID=282301 RepID=A0A1I8IX09_9PLAT